MTLCAAHPNDVPMPRFEKFSVTEYYDSLLV